MILRSWPVRPINPLFTIPRFNAQTGGWPPRCYSPTSHQLSLPRPLVALSRSLEADDGKTAGLLRQPQANATFSRDAVDWTQRQDQMTTDVCRVTRKSNGDFRLGSIELREHIQAIGDKWSASRHGLRRLL
jgi:hypothetical protein